MVLGLVSLALIVAWNAFFVAAEYAFISANPLKLKDMAREGSTRAERVLHLQRDPTRFISAVQVAITASSLAAGAVGEPAVRRVVGGAFDPLGDTVGSTATLAISIIIAFSVVTAVTVVLGEIVPKTACLVYPERVAVIAIGPVRLFSAVFRPFVAALERLSRLTTRLLGLPEPSMVDRRNAEELRLIVESSSEEGILEEDEQRMLLGVLELPDTQVRTVMVPRPDVVALNVGMGPAEAAAVVRQHPYTRYPVHGGELDDIRGTLHVRRLLEAMDTAAAPADLAPLLRPAQLVLETSRLDDLLTRFRRGRDHLAVVVDEYGSVAGVVTLEDLIEEIVGDVHDEHDGAERAQVQPLVDGGWLVSGLLRSDEVVDATGFAMPDGPYETLAGLVLAQLGRLPDVGDELVVDGRRFTVTRRDRNRVAELRMHPAQPAPAVQEASRG